MFPFSKCEDRRPGVSPGSILAVVLGLIALAGFILIAFMEEATARIKYSGLFSNRDDLRVQAYSMLETSFAVINEIREIDRGLYGPAQGWGDPLGYAGIEPPEDYDVEIVIEDETGKISLLLITPQALNVLFEEMGIPLDEAESLTDALLDWTDEDDLTRLDGAETDFYETNDPPYKPANAPLQSWYELRLIKGFDTLFFDPEGDPNEYYRQFLSAVSIYHDQPVNINSAGALVLTVLSRVEGIDITGLFEYLNGADEVRGTGDDRLIIDRDSPYFPVGQQQGSQMGMADMFTGLFKITVSVHRGEAGFLLSTVAAWSGANPSAASGTIDPTRTIQQTQLQTRRLKQAAKTDYGSALGSPFHILHLSENRRL